ncbi:MAG: discoidin domain-containing protein, partial [Asticcacaulis sp.]|nr:discoidin domain-containing protein [Asticcacaulis sp.]
MRRILPIAAVLTLAASAAQAAERHTYANPIDIDYRYNFEQMNDGISYRTGADPVIVLHKGSYYLFETLADGYWRSDNLLDWHFITPSRWPFNSIVAPAVISDGDQLIIMPSSMKPQALLSTTDPDSGRLDFYTRLTPPLPNAAWDGQAPTGDQIPSGPWDPGLFKDDDGKWYLYWDSSNLYPIYGIELDPAKKLAYIGKPRPLFALDPDKHGWERFGQDHSGTLPNGTPIRPFLEGAWMNKVGGKYYLQYGAPGTEYNAYSNGTYVSDSPLGPFTYADYNPVAYKPGGFVEGAGHGSTFADKYGNYWNTGTPWIGYNWTFERRIDLLPVKFYDDGQMAASSRFGDFPHYVPTAKIEDPEALFTGWMLLSYRKPMTASSVQGDFAPSNADDENPRTFWLAADAKPGQTLTVDLGATRTVRAIQVNYADYKSGLYADSPDIYTEFELQSSVDGRSWTHLADTGAERRDRPNAYIELSAPMTARYIRYVHGHIGAPNLAIADLRVFGSADGALPAAPQGITAKRDSDARNAHIAWKPVKCSGAAVRQRCAARGD